MHRIRGRLGTAYLSVRLGSSRSICRTGQGLGRNHLQAGIRNLLVRSRVLHRYNIDLRVRIS